MVHPVIEDKCGTSFPMSFESDLKKPGNQEPWVLQGNLGFRNLGVLDHLP